jgi:hypothetical protein
MALFGLAWMPDEPPMTRRDEGEKIEAEKLNDLSGSVD